MINHYRSFAFYIKYWDEMEYLYKHLDNGKTKKLLQRSGLKNTDEILYQIKEVGDMASEQAAKLLFKCNEAVISHLNKFCNVKNRRTISGVKNDWWTEIRLKPNSKKKWRATAGVSLSNANSNNIFSFIWVPSEKEESLYDFIKSTKISKYVGRSYEEGYMSGCVLFGKVNPKNYIRNYELEEKRLINDVVKSFLKINSNILRKIFKAADV